MTGIYYKTGGEWVQADRLYVKQSGVWKSVTDGYRKDSGTWKQFYLFDETPPDAPLITLNLRTFDTGRYIDVGVRANGLNNDPNLKMIRVLTTYLGKAPTTQYGATYTTKSDPSYTDEPWSDWHYNRSTGHPDSSVEVTKRWPRGATKNSTLAGGQTYYFTAWAQDMSGNWSVANAATIFVPKTSAIGSKFVGEARFSPTNAGKQSSEGFAAGDLVQQGNPASRGYFFYGNQINQDIGSRGPATITSAQIRVERRNDSGSAQANVYLFWHEYGNPTALPGSPTRHEPTLLGTIGKGEAKWFDIPQSMWPDMTGTTLKGFGLDNKNPVFAAAQADDYSVVTNINEALRCGEVHVTWTEDL